MEDEDVVMEDINKIMKNISIKTSNILNKMLKKTNEKLSKFIIDDTINIKNNNNKLLSPPPKLDIIPIYSPPQDISLTQYSILYKSRYKESKEKLLKICKAKYKKIEYIENILDLKGNEKKIIIGITYKEMALKPSVLKNIENILGSKKIESFMNEDDYLCVEDLSGRIRINKELSKIQINEICSGIPIGCIGNLDEKGLFIIDEYVFYNSDIFDINYYISNNNLNNNNNDFSFNQSENNILLISNLSIGNPNTPFKNNYNLIISLLINFIQNIFNNNNSIEKLFLLGNNIFSPEETELVEKGSYLKQDLNNKVYNTISDNYENLDNILKIISNSIPIYILSSEDDINSEYFPQNQINSILFENCESLIDKNLFFLNNPEYINYNNENKILFCGGNNINNLKKITNLDQLNLIYKTLLWGHLAPNSPDTLRTFSLSKDNLIMNDIPDQYIVGNQSNFNYVNVERTDKKITSIVTVPNFCETGEIVVWNIKEKKGKVIQFNIN